MMGSFEEFGPFLLNNLINFKDNSTFFVENPYTWALDNYLLFVDSPVGVGKFIYKCLNFKNNSNKILVINNFSHFDEK